MTAGTTADAARLENETSEFFAPYDGRVANVFDADVSTESATDPSWCPVVTVEFGKCWLVLAVWLLARAERRTQA
jgi:hypothetical protein